MNQTNNNHSHDMELDSSIERNRSKDKGKIIKIINLLIYNFSI